MGCIRGLTSCPDGVIIPVGYAGIDKTRIDAFASLFSKGDTRDLGIGV